MTTLRARIEEVIRDGLVKDAKAWSLDAELTKGHVTMLLRRLDGDAKTVQLDTLDKLADAAKISRAWLSHGIGDRRPDRFRERAVAARRARNLPRLQAEISPEAVESVLTGERWQKADLSTRGAVWWLEEMKAETIRLRREAAHTVVRDAIDEKREAAKPAPKPATAKVSRSA